MQMTMKVEYCQTFDKEKGVWEEPLRKVSNGCKPIHNLASVTSKKWHYNGAIMRMKLVFDRMRDAEGRRMWKTKITTKKSPEKVVTKELTCFKVSYGFSRSL